VRLSHLGDVVCTLPLLETLRAAFPRACIGWVVQSEYADLLRAHPALDEVLTFDRRAGLDGLLRLERDLAAFHADWVVDAQGNAKSALVALTSRASRRTGSARVDWAETIASASSNDLAEPAQGRLENAAGAVDAAAPVHLIDRLRALARHATRDARVAGFDADACYDRAAESAFRVGAPNEGRAIWIETFGAHAAARSNARRPRVIVHASRAHDPRSWPVAHVEACVGDLARDHDVLVVCGPEDADEGARLSAAFAETASVRVRREPLALRSLASVLRAAAEEGAVFAGGDTGPTHLAWSAGLRVVTWIGPTDERATGPWPVPVGRPNDRHRVVRAEVALACAPCRERTCAHPEGNVCLVRIEPAAVARRVRELTNPVPS